MKTAMLIAAGAAALSLAPAALADAPTEYVDYNPAELTHAEGVDRIKARIARTAERVCSTPSRPTLRERQLRQACVAEAIEKAEAQLERRVALARARQLAGAAETAAG